MSDDDDIMEDAAPEATDTQTTATIDDVDRDQRRQAEQVTEFDRQHMGNPNGIRITICNFF